MSVKTCRFCGKSLSRIWVGGGEFCSREHRDQYRLRCGMDRLLEANKVATLMRRRENPKQVMAARPIGIPDDSRHSYSRAGAAPFAGVGAATPILAHIRTKLDTSHSLPQARVALFRFPASEAPRDRRNFGILRHPVLHLWLGDRVFDYSSASAPAARTYHQARQPLVSPAPARRGKALRVSASVGFRLLPPERPAPAFGIPRVGGLAEGLHFSPAPAPVAPRDQAKALENHFRVPPVRIPRVNGPPMAAQFAWPGIQELTAPPERLPTDMGTRACWVPWNPSTDVAAPGPGKIVDLHGLSGRHALSVPQEPAGASPGDRRATVVRFVPQDSVLTCSPMAIHGTVAGRASDPWAASGATQQRRAPVPVRTCLEEHFAAGWENWVGGVDDWKVDAAGVRTGSLALFRPSLDLRDYELEFMARIENRSVSWVIRAADFDEYCLVRIAVRQEGGFELSRRVLAGGVAEAPTVTPIEIGAGSKPAVTVRTRVNGDEFTVSVDGQVVERWQDPRLPIGGIGFVGEPDDHARLYWVRLSFARNARKEKSKK